MSKKKADSAFAQLCKDTVAVVLDECHHGSATSWMTVLDQMHNAVIRVGLTGTVDSKKKTAVRRLEGVTSHITCRISNQYLIEQGVSAKPTCYIFPVEPDETDLDNVPFQLQYDLGIVNNEYRNWLITEICKKEASEGNHVLVLVDRLEQGNNIWHNLLEEDMFRMDNGASPQYFTYFTNGQLESDMRSMVLDMMKEGAVSVLIASSILDEGVDISGINALIYARGMKSQRKLLQGIGRGLRAKADGSGVAVYDFIDNSSKILARHSQERLHNMEAEGFDIVNLDAGIFLQ